MAEIVRYVREEELEEFEVFLERCFGHGRYFFRRHYPDISVPEIVTSSCMVIEADGKIVSHVGAYPMEIVVGPARIPTGGIGGVATLPEYRGRGYMSRLMEETVREMKSRGWSLSVLWGDRQRYGTFGYETCGLKYSVALNRRSLERTGVEPVEVREVDPADSATVEHIRRFHGLLPCSVERPRLELTLQRYGVRTFLADDGYLISRREMSGDLQAVEVVSESGREAGIVLGALNWTFGYSASVSLGPDEGERSRRILAACNYWTCGPQGMFRIVDWPLLLEHLRPLLQQRAAELAVQPFDATIGCRWRDEVQWARVAWNGSELAVEKADGGGVEIDLRLLTAYIVGGPFVGREALGPFGQLLPVPLHIPELDHV